MFKLEVDHIAFAYGNMSRLSIWECRVDWGVIKMGMNCSNKLDIAHVPAISQLHWLTGEHIYVSRFIYRAYYWQWVDSCPGHIIGSEWIHVQGRLLTKSVIPSTAYVQNPNWTQRPTTPLTGCMVQTSTTDPGYFWVRFSSELLVVKSCSGDLTIHQAAAQ